MTPLRRPLLAALLLSSACRYRYDELASTTQPSEAGASRCSGILTSGIWQDRTCTGAEPFICESR